MRGRKFDLFFSRPFILTEYVWKCAKQCNCHKETQPDINKKDLLTRKLIEGHYLSASIVLRENIWIQSFEITLNKSFLSCPVAATLKTDSAAPTVLAKDATIPFAISSEICHSRGSTGTLHAEPFGSKMRYFKTSENNHHQDAYQQSSPTQQCDCYHQPDQIMRSIIKNQIIKMYNKEHNSKHDHYYPK